MDNQQIVANVEQFYSTTYLFNLLEEESAEYIVAARHYFRPDRPEGADERFSEMLQEAADIAAVLLALRAVIGEHNFDSMVNSKMQRWQRRMDELAAKVNETMEHAPCNQNP